MLAALRDLIQRPSDNPTAAAVVVVIIVLAVILAVVALAAAGLPRERSAGSGGAAARRRRLGRRVGIVALALVLASLALVLVGYGLTSSNTVCGTRCHAMSAPHMTWRTSSHASVSCVRCHEGRVLLSLPAAITVRGGSLQAELEGRRRAGTSSVPSSRCLECHRDVLAKVTVRDDGLAMSHEQVVKAGASCEDCHGAQGHEKTGRVPPMAACLRCHDGEKASTACASCHRPVAASRALPDDDRYVKARTPGEADCGGCHSRTACDDCHGIRMPHPDGFKEARQHARAAAFDRKQRLCYRCHTFADCRSCHLAFGWHGDTWEREHAKADEARSCAECHSSPDICALCHSR